jgi:hypothetical protein
MIFFVTIGTQQAFIIIETAKGGNSEQCLVLFLVERCGIFFSVFLNKISNYLGETRNEKLSI